jgi:hypothetical protein
MRAVKTRRILTRREYGIDLSFSTVSTFFEWLQRGEGRSQERGPARVYAQFARAVRRAKAEAQVAAEITVRRTDPNSS